MNNVKKCIPYLCILLFFISCSGRKNILPQPVWGYRARGIKIHYIAKSNLNFYGGGAHTLVLKIFQLKDSAHFKDLAQTRAGFIRLLQFSGQPNYLGDGQTDILSYKQLIVRPGEEKIIYLDRAEGAKWVGIVAGYYRINLLQSYKVFKIPLIYRKEGLIFKKQTVTIGELFINLILGPSGLQKVGG